MSANLLLTASTSQFHTFSKWLNAAISSHCQHFLRNIYTSLNAASSVTELEKHQIL